MKYITIGGKRFRVRRSNRKDKKFKIMHKGRWMHFGAKGYRVGKRGGKKWRSYCKRSAGIKSRGMINPNSASRAMWRC